MIDLLLCALASEAAIELWKKAAPLSGIKSWLVSITPWLYSESQQQHLLLCPYCLSLWVAVPFTLFYFTLDVIAIRCIIYLLVIHRLSNYIHLVFSLVRDMQLDIRVARKR